MKDSKHPSAQPHSRARQLQQLTAPKLMRARPSALAWSVRAALGIALTSALVAPAFAEGTKQWSPDASDYSALGVVETGSGSATVYPFAGYGQPADNRLYIHINDPATEQIHIGLSELERGIGGTANVTYYFRIVAPDGTVVHGPYAVGGATGNAVNLSSHATAAAGPNTVNASGYNASGIWTFDPATAGKGAGDYYIEFDLDNNAGTVGSYNYVDSGFSYTENNMSIRWFDFTVATKTSPQAIDGRVWSKNWGVRAANPTTYAANPFAESFDGALYAYDSNHFVTKVDFNGSGLRPLQGQFSFNDTGTGTTGAKDTDRKSVMNANKTTPKHQIFLSQPDPNIYPLGVEGQLQNLPLKIDNINNTTITVEVTQPGNAEIVLDINNDGVYSAGVDRRIFATLVAGVNQIAWDGKDGAGNKVTKAQFPIATLLSYTQGETHFTAYDVEGLDNGLHVYTQTTGGLTGPNLLFWDDSNITQPSGAATTTLTNTDTGATTRQTWNYVSADFTTGYGNANTINTWWYAHRAYQTTLLVANNNPPVATNDTGSTNEDTPLNGSTVLSNDTDADGDTLTVNTTPTVLPTHGSVVLNANGTYVYTPNADFNGTDTFTYEVSDGSGGTATATVTITVNPVNDAPVANDDTGTTAEDTPLNGTTVLSNDTDVDGDTLTVNTTPTVMPSHGSVVLKADGTYTYTPNANYNGTDTFSYQISDGNGGTDTAVVNLTITPANDAPVATDDTGTTAEDTALNGTTVSANDSDLDGDTLTINTTPTVLPTHGSVVLKADGTYTYTPNADFNGTDSFTYEISDGNGGKDTAVVTITVTPTNDPPVATDDTASTSENTALNGTTVLSNDTDVDGDTLTVNTTPIAAPTHGTLTLNADGTYTYTPTNNYSGTDSFTYEVQDGKGGTDTAVVTITIAAVNHAPVATNDSATATEDTPLNGTTVLSNDSDPDGDTLTVTTTPTVAPTNGTLVLNSDGTYTYTPNADFNGADAFTYEVTDGKGGKTTATVSITVAAANDAPVASDDTGTTAEDTALNGTTVLSNDTDVDGDTLTVNTTPTVLPAHGSVVLNADGTYTYTPNANYNGTDTFSYEISDGKGGTDAAVVTITITPSNDAPVANNDTATTQEDQPLNGTTVLANDSDVDGDTLTVNTTPTVLPTNGTVVLNADGTYTYTPNANFNGTDTFTYEVSDGNGGKATATVTITVGVQNDPPVATDDTATTNEDTVLNGTTVLANDTDADGDTLTVNTTPTVLPTNGSVVLNADGTYAYTPNANFNGTDSFTYEVSDGKGGMDTAVVTITIAAVNDVPLANDDTASITEDGVLNGANLLGNDSDTDGDTLTINTTPTVLPTNGTVVLNADGTYTYTPTANFNGTDSFTYEISDGKGGTDTAVVTITVTPVNDVPVATDDSASGTEDTVLNGTTVLANDTDIDGDTLSVTTTPTVLPTNGSVILNADGTYAYTPNANFSGTDSFTYEISDGNGGKDTAVVTITIAPANDAPLANDDTATTSEDGVLNGTNLLGNDTDLDGDTLTINTTPTVAPTHGTLVINADGTYTYTPTANYNGTDTFTYEISDGKGGTDTAVVTITIAPVNDAPVATDDAATTPEDTVLNGTTVLANDSDLDVDTLTVNTAPTVAPSNGTLVLNADGTYAYTPNTNFSGTDTFTYEVSDGNGGTDTAVVTITVVATNDAPVATDDTATTNEDTPLNGTTVLANDSDLDGDTLTVNTAPIVAPTNGALVLKADGTYTYTPNANFNGTDTFTYEVSDGKGGTDTAVVTITVTAVNDVPVATDDSATTTEDTVLNGTTVLANDADVDGDTLTINTTPTAAPTNGTVVINTDGTYAYTPNANFNGTDTFTYEISDGKGGTDTATVTITVTAANDLPVATDDAGTTAEDTVLNGTTVLANDTDADGDTLSANPVLIAAPTHGTVGLNTDGTYSYTPNADFNGTDSFTYEVQDGKGGTDTAVVTLTVTPVNDKPVANDDTATTKEDQPLTGTTVLDNDTDVDGDTLTVNTTPITPPANGTLVLNADGTYTYTPNANFNGTDTFTYEISDGNGATATATVTITVGVENDAPVAVDDTATTNEDTVLDGTTVLANDTDADGDKLTVNTAPIVAPSNGSLVLNADGTYHYTPNVNFHGTDTFTYEVTDGNGGMATATVTITVNSVNDVPVANDDVANVTEDTPFTGTTLLGNDTDDDGDTLTINTTPVIAPTNGTLLINTDGTYTYTPNANFHGTDTFTYEISDGNGGKDTAVVNVTVTSVNDLPVATDDAATTDEDTPVTGQSLLANDSDADGDTLTLNTTPVVPPAHGAVVMNADATYTYTPNANFNGTDTFTYEVSDGQGGIDTAVVTITVNAVNDAPIANDDSVSILEDTVLNGSSVLGNDTDVDGDTLTVNTTPTVAPAHGTVELKADGTYTYTPAKDFNGTDTFTYEISDGNGSTDTAVVTINITPVNDAPLITSDINVTFAENGTGTVLDVQSTDDNDAESKGLTYSLQPLLDGAVFNIDPVTGAITFKTPPNYEAPQDTNGDNAYIVMTRVCDSGNLCTDQVEVIVVTNVIETRPPIITSTVVNTPENQNFVTTVAATDPDAGDTLSFSINGGTDASLFIIDPSTGELRFVTAPDFENPVDTDKNNVYDVVVSVWDNTAPDHIDSQALKVTVTDVQENTAPTISSDGAGDTASLSITEEETAITTVQATDAQNDTLIYTISGGDDAALFQIDPTTGKLSFKATPDFENPADANKDNQYVVTVKAQDPLGASDTQTMTVGVTNAPDIRLQVRGFLEGAYESSTGMMRDSLRSSALLPLAQPYSATPFSYAGTEATNETQLAVTGNDAPVDWVLVELRDATKPATRIAAITGLLQRDGDVMDAATGSTTLALDKISAGSYYVTLRHRNHLAVTTGAAVALSASTPALIDFTQAATVTMGSNARFMAEPIALLWAGDASQNDTIIANGPSNDTNVVLGAVLTDPNNTLVNSNFRLGGYAVTDLNMDGQTIFAGPGNDINLMLGNVLLHPSNSTTAANYIINGSLPK